MIPKYDKLMNTTISKTLLFIALTAVFMACDELGKGQISETSGIFEASNSILNFRFVSHTHHAEQIDSTLTATAEFLAGIPNEALPYARQRHYYQKHLAQTQQFRKKIIETQIIPMRDWAEKYNISEISDSTTLFYPYGEGQFLQAYTMFPHCKNYILTGTKIAGKVPDLKYTPDPILEDYLARLREHLLISEEDKNTDYQEFNSEKYFQSEAAIHQILVHLAQAGRRIIRISEIGINNFGAEKRYTESTNKNPFGLKIEFCGTNPDEQQNLYYFNIELSDSSLKIHPAFDYFLTEKGSKITFLHSENYLLHLTNFEKIRGLILTQSTKIIGDETGIPFAYLNDSGFEVKLYGVPSGGQKNIFRENWKKGIDYEETGELPFELSLGNRPLTALLFARLYPESDTQIVPEKQAENHIELAEVLVHHLPAPSGAAPMSKQNAQKPDYEEITNQKERPSDSKIIQKSERKLVQDVAQKEIFRQVKNTQKMASKSTQQTTPKISEKKVIKIGASSSQSVRYKVQIGIFLDVPNPHDDRLKNLPKLDFYKTNGSYRYTVGNEISREACTKILQKVKANGFAGAFIVAFRNGKRISMNDAQKMGQ